jgi:hypothetical protein
VKIALIFCRHDTTTKTKKEAERFQHSTSHDSIYLISLLPIFRKKCTREGCVFLLLEPSPFSQKQFDGLKACMDKKEHGVHHVMVYPLFNNFPLMDFAVYLIKVLNSLSIVGGGAW